MGLFALIRKDSLDLAHRAGAKALVGFEQAVHGLTTANEHLDAVITDAEDLIDHLQGRHAAATSAKQTNETVITRIKALTS